MDTERPKYQISQDRGIFNQDIYNKIISNWYSLPEQTKLAGRMQKRVR